MIKLGIISTMLLYFFSMIRWGIIVAITFSSCYLVILIFFYYRKRFKVKLKKYGSMFENIYEYQKAPTDKQVLLRVEKHKKWLRLSKNKMNVQVRMGFFRDSRNPNESWEEYELRRDEEIAEDRKKRHKKLEKKHGRNFYLTDLHGQKTKETFTGTWYKVVLKNQNNEA